MSTKTILCILDGLGLNPQHLGNAVAQAATPTLDYLLKTYPNTTLLTHGERVGLPAGQMGNSEVGHLNIGAGRVVEQWLLLIEKTLRENTHLNNPAFINFLKICDKSKQVHVFGLLSKGGVHSDSEHLLLLLDSLTANNKQEILLHLISDGRDVAPNAFYDDLKELQVFLTSRPQIKIASIHGRFYAMDRDSRWERIEKAYRTICGSVPQCTTTPLEHIQQCYKSGITDEFIEPVRFLDYKILEQDGFLFWNFRADRMRELVSCLCLKDFNQITRSHPIPTPEQVLCFANYSAEFKLPYLFAQSVIENYLGAVVADAGLKQLRVAETEKYPHVTYFLNGGSETCLPGEERTLIPSPRDVKTYDLKPEMSALAVKQTVLDAITSQSFDLIVVNFANCDMVGHTGVLSAAIKAVETVDNCLGEIVNTAKTHNMALLVIADHGNAEQMIDYATNTAHTAHTTFPVPCILISDIKCSLRDNGALCDVAPTVLDVMGLAKPDEMTGRTLIL